MGEGLQATRPEGERFYLAEGNRRCQRQALALPHTADLINGLMHDWNDSNGRPIDEAYALHRVLNEPLAEISQTKGQSETHPLLSPDDEFANYEVMYSKTRTVPISTERKLSRSASKAMNSVRRCLTWSG